jgi:hypothetical protein
MAVVIAAATAAISTWTKALTGSGAFFHKVVFVT